MYILLVLIGAVAVDAVENSKKQFWYEWFAGMAGMLLPVLFYYLTYREISIRIMVSAVADGVVVFLFLHLCYRKLVDARNAEVDEVMVDITDESYPLARGAGEFFQGRLQPCKAGDACGGAMCCCGRGRRTCVQRRGDVLPYRRTGGRTACKKRCENGTESLLPGEGNPHYRGNTTGEEALPSTIESAIVHMVDGLLKKLEVLDEDTVGSNWNQDMVIYQTLNEYSAAGAV